MKIEYNHNLNTAEALKRLKNFASEAKEKYKEHIQDVSEEWDGNKCNFYIKALGSKANGTLEVFENKIITEIKLPLMAKPFQGQIKQIILDTFKELLNG